MTVIDNLFLGSVPATGPRALVMKVTIAPPALTEVDLRQKMDLALFVGCQAVYVDASKVTADITMTTSMGQKLTFKKGTQGYYPILEGVAMKFLFTADTFQQIEIIFLNQPLAVGVWGDGGSEYELPIASETVLGGVKVGDGLAITDGVLSATGGTPTPTQLAPLIITSENSVPSIIDQPSWVSSAVVNADHVVITVNVDVKCEISSAFMMTVNTFTGEDCYTKIVETVTNSGESPESYPKLITATNGISGETLANVFGKIDLITGNEFIAQEYSIYINVPVNVAGMVSIQPV